MAERRDDDGRDASATPTGFMADGPGFHVWEETHEETARRASELATSLTLDQARVFSRRGRPGARRHAEAREPDDAPAE